MRYTVEIVQTYYVTVDAEDEQQAAEIALDCLDDSSYSDTEVTNVEEAEI